MEFDLLIQVVFISITVFMFLWMQNIPQKFIDKVRFRDRTSYAAKRHFVLGAEFLARSRSAGDRIAAVKLAKSAEEQADLSISLNPTDAASHILRSLALDSQGFTTSAVDAIDVALSPLAVKSLSDGERGDALYKRAEIKVKASGGGKGGDGVVESAVADLVESVRLKAENAAAFRLLGELYEKKEMKLEAVKAYSAAAEIEPESKLAKEALARLSSST